MKLYERVDAYIADNHDGYGEEFHRADLESWFVEMEWDVDGGDALQAHKKAVPTFEKGKQVRGRLFTTERVGMGPRSFYRIVQTDHGQTPVAVRRMHLQQTQEMISRWEVEARDRMAPLFRRDRRVLAYFNKAATQMKLVAVTLDQDIQSFLDEILGGEE